MTDIAGAAGATPGRAAAGENAPVHAGHHIGGRGVEGSSGATFASRNPAHWSETVAVLPLGTAADVDMAVAEAHRALAGWRRTPWPARGEIILRAGLILEERREELARLMTREMGKVLTEARGDVQEGIDMAKYIAGAARRPFGETVPSELRSQWAMTMRQPLGVVGIITPWNFPVAIPTWKLFPALLAGNTVVFKPAEDTPLCALRLVEILEAAGLPAGVVNIVFGDGTQTGEALIRHAGVRAVSFTGSVPTGRHIGEVCGALLKRCSLELGGKNAIVVMDDADVDLAVDGALWGAFGTSGQRCTASSRLIVARGVLGDFTDALLARAGALRLGDGLDPAVEIGPVINEAQLDRVHVYTGIGLEEGAELLLGGDIAREGGLGGGWFYRPTVFGSVRAGARIEQEEIFGPTTCIVPVGSFDEGMRVANGTGYGLSLALYTRDLSTAFHAVEELESGIVYVNAPTIGAQIQLPFGGIKNTGNGHREAGTVALDQFSEWKSIYIDYSGRLQRAQIDVE